MTVLLEASALHKSYRLPRRSVFSPAARRRAVDGVDLALTAGRHLGIVGESGSGKSTLTRLLLGLERPDAGSVTYRGVRVQPGRQEWFRREVQVVLQDPRASLDPRMTVRQIIAEPLSCLSVPGSPRARIAEVLAAVGLDPAMAERYPHELSGGQRQRIAIARALAPGPTVLIGDEPLSALDVVVRSSVLALLRGLADEFGLTLVLVSHDIGVVQHLCADVLVMKDGVVVERGSTADVLGDPQHPYTQALLAAVPRLPSEVP
jgi:peptide/nickel transport system ATP-binding protein